MHVGKNQTIAFPNPKNKNLLSNPLENDLNKPVFISAELLNFLEQTSILIWVWEDFLWKQIRGQKSNIWEIFQLLFVFLSSLFWTIWEHRCHIWFGLFYICFPLVLSPRKLSKIGIDCMVSNRHIRVLLHYRRLHYWNLFQFFFTFCSRWRQAKNILKTYIQFPRHTEKFFLHCLFWTRIIQIYVPLLWKLR